MLDILIKNAHIIDGSGSPAYDGHVGIKDDPSDCRAPSCS